MNPTNNTGAPFGAPASPYGAPRAPHAHRYYITPTRHGSWLVMFGDEIIDGYRAKSRSRVETRRLLNHMNQKLKEAENLYSAGIRKALKA
jgi:hypothetical protein